MYRLAIAALGVVTALTAMPPAATAQGPSQRIVITAAKMIDVTTGKVTEFPAIFVEGGRITSISDARTVRWGEDVKHIDQSGKTLLPGLIDMHVHLDSSPTYGGYDSLQFTDRFWTVIGVGNTRAMLDAGFTTVRNVGSEGYNDVVLKQAIAEGWAVGPRIVPAAHALGATGGHCDQTYLPPSFDAKTVAVGDGVVEYGMTPLDAIRAATINAAQALGRTQDVGTIAVGRYADLIAVDGDPLADVRELESVDAVIQGGVQIR